MLATPGPNGDAVLEAAVVQAARGGLVAPRHHVVVLQQVHDDFCVKVSQRESQRQCESQRHSCVLRCYLACMLAALARACCARSSLVRQSQGTGRQLLVLRSSAACTWRLHAPSVLL